MALIDNPRKLSPENVQDEQKQLVAYLAEILNYFMEQTTNVVNGRLDFNNLNRELVEISVKVDSNSKPTEGGQFISNFRTLRGHRVLQGRNLDDSSVYETGAPYLVLEGDGRGTYTIQKAFGLPAGYKFQLLVELIP